MSQNWVKKNGGSDADGNFYSCCVRNLLMSADQAAFTTLLAEYERQWSQAFREHYSANLSGAVTSSTSFTVRALNIEQVPYVGITNNVCESYNRVLKDFQNWKVGPAIFYVYVSNKMLLFYVCIIM